MERYSFKNIEKKWRNNIALLSVVNQKSECFNQSAEGCVHHQVRIPF